MSAKSKRSQTSNRAKVMGTMAAVLLFGAAVPAAGAAEGIATGTGYASASAASSTAEASAASGNSLTAKDVKVTQEEAAAKVRKLFPVLSQAEIQDTRLTDDSPYGPGSGGSPMWEISFVIRNGNSSTGFSVRVDAMTGDLRNVYLPYEMTRGASAYPPKVTRSQALEIAKKFLEEAAPSMKGQKLQEDPAFYGKGFTVTPLFGPVSYDFMFTSYHDGVLVNGQSLQISVSGEGVVTSFSSYADSLAFPSSQPKVTAEEAKKRLETDLKLQLAYASSGPYGNPSPDSWHLIYAPAVPIGQMDAQTGEWLDGVVNPVSAKPPEYAAMPEPAKPFAPKAVTAEEAAAKVAASADLPEGYTLVSRSLQKGRNGGHDTWSLRWQDEKNSPFNGRWAEVDAATGQILSFRVDFYGPGYPQEQPSANKPLSVDEAYRIADEWVSANVPNIASYRRVAKPAVNVGSENQSEYTSVSYQLFHNGIPVQNDVLSVTLDGKGKLYNYYGPATPDEASFRKMDTLKASLTEDQAKALYLKKAELELAFTRYGGYYVTPPGKYVNPAIKLVYQLVDAETKQGLYRSLDAVTGQWIELYSSPAAQVPAATPKDIEGHWGEDALKTMLEHGVIRPDDEGLVHPDRKATKGDLVRMLASALNPYLSLNESYGTVAGDAPKPFADVEPGSPEYAAVNQLLERKWLVSDPQAKLNPESPLTRDQLAVFLSKVTGYEKLSAKLADLPDFTRLTDANAVAHPGAAALALKLGLLTPQSGEFRPNDPVTVAQLAVVLVRLAENQIEWDRPLVQ
ncbi:YcdB/YcdC domain-containing protein [Cohnella caldifontis]|uniref:YcdB/YcdC domain-containing protein n=1 Tax=Cohnella caldifontis TaxID=3027471 RepID=UPI0023EC7931|nr:YcdB/YcdC domain-containing protein [Cohnella sp. YIM B05605]